MEKESNEEMSKSEVQLGTCSLLERQNLLQNCVCFEERLDKKLKELNGLLCKYDEEMKEILAGLGSAGRKGGGLMGGIKGKREGLFLKLKGDIEEKANEVRVELAELLGEVASVVNDMTSQETIQEWDGSSIEVFSGFDNAGLGIDDESEASGKKIDGETEDVGSAAVGKTEVINEVEVRVQEKSSEKGGGGMSLEEGFARMERMFEKRIGEEMVRMENRILNKLDRKGLQTGWNEKRTVGGGDSFAEKKDESAKDWGFLGEGEGATSHRTWKGRNLYRGSKWGPSVRSEEVEDISGYGGKAWNEQRKGVVGGERVNKGWGFGSGRNWGEQGGESVVAGGRGGEYGDQGF